MRAGVYLRQSLDRTGDELAVTRQRHACEQLCTQRGWSIVQTITDNDTSATVGTRKGFVELLKAIEDNKVDVVVCYHADRLARSLVDLEQVISRCERAGVKLATVSGDLDLSTDTGRLVARILASVAKGEVERKGARQRDANQQHAQMGRPPAGPVPFGFMSDRVTHHPDEAPAIKRAYEDILAGATLASIARQWNTEGLLSGHVRTGAIKRGSPSQWRAETVRAVLLKARNAGLRTYKGEQYPAIWQGIVPEETWRAAVSVLTDPSRQVSLPSAKHLLSGVALCGVCGSPMNAGTGRRGYHAYRCRSSLGHVARRGDQVDDFITDLCVERLSRPDAIHLLRDKHAEVDIPALRAKATALRRRIDEVALEFADDDDISPAQLRVVTRRLRTKLETIEATLAEAGRVNVLAQLIGAEDVREAWDAIGADKQRAVVETLIYLVLHPVGKGARVFDQDTIWTRWKADR